jgi:MtrB/PioB family decaheme-associated outer membrane protein
MNRIRRISLALLAPAFAFALGTPSLRADDARPAAEPTVKVEGVVGGQYVDDTDGLGKARFEEYRDVPSSVVFEFGRIEFLPKDGKSSASLTLQDVGQDDQRYFLNVAAGRFSLDASYRELPHLYATSAKTLWSGAGTGQLTLGEPFRAGAEAAAGAPTAPFASPALQTYMESALAAAGTFELGTKRKDLDVGIGFALAPGFTLRLDGRYDKKDGTKPLGFGTYIRRQALAGTPGTGAGTFWRETVEARGSELIEPVDWKTSEFGASLQWARNGHSASAGVFLSRFRNDVTALYFDNPFQASPGQASASVFDPSSDQEPASPNGNNNLRGLYARSSTALWPNNDLDRFFGNASIRVTDGTRLNVNLSQGTMTQDDAFMPYAESDKVVYSGKAGEPGVVYAKDAPLPRASLGGKMVTTQADVKITSRLTDALSARAGYRYYDLDDQRPSIFFPGYSSSGDSYFRRGIGQKDAAGNKALYNVVGGYTRQVLDVGVAYRLGLATLDAQYSRRAIDYDERQVEKTAEDELRATVRLALGSANVNASYTLASRDFEGSYNVGLESSGVRAFDVWTRDRDAIRIDADVPVGEEWTIGAGAGWTKDDYPGAVTGFTYGWGLQDASTSSVWATASWATEAATLSAWAGVDRSEWNSLQVTKTSQGADYAPKNRWTREAADDAYWIGFELLVPLSAKATLKADVNYQRYRGDWDTTNLETPDVNSAVAYAFPEVSDSTLTARASFLWKLNDHVTLEARYWYEPYRLDDFTIDGMKPYMQGALKETRSSPSDVGDMNVSRFLFLDSRYGKYTANVLSAMVHLSF